MRYVAVILVLMQMLLSAMTASHSHAHEGITKPHFHTHSRHAADDSNQPHHRHSHCGHVVPPKSAAVDLPLSHDEDAVYVGEEMLATQPERVLVPNHDGMDYVPVLPSGVFSSAQFLTVDGDGAGLLPLAVSTPQSTRPHILRV